ncbi:hypothetical protein L249_1729 [Ophiocordyceps polyrhachis-furcata BCC 54312]|uniref:F-box domain-containing protein n=1 Tax=Ophiocordyceps polyrhachis-furcata BCC 54312 TaxID=1330021 RepID=A0A367LMW0_9HYPO|nr:hypothetical protein L249_1729 [Ophiocordyceps polyrhachis-furcata BCC 54312]
MKHESREVGGAMRRFLGIRRHGCLIVQSEKTRPPRFLQTRQESFPTKVDERHFQTNTSRLNLDAENVSAMYLQSATDQNDIGISPIDPVRAMTQEEKGKIMRQLDGEDYNIEQCLSPGHVLHGRDVIEDTRVAHIMESPNTTPHSSLLFFCMLSNSRWNTTFSLRLFPSPKNTQIIPNIDLPSEGGTITLLLYSIASYLIRDETIPHLTLPHMPQSINSTVRVPPEPTDKTKQRPDKDQSSHDSEYNNPAMETPRQWQRRDSQQTLISLLQLDPSPIESPPPSPSPILDKELPPLPARSGSSTAGAPGLSASGGRGAIFYLTRLQRYSSFATGLFASIHLANVSLIPLVTRSVPGSETYLLMTRELYQTPLAEPLVVALPVVAHVGAGFALRLLRRWQNMRRYGAATPAMYALHRKRTTTNDSVRLWPSLSYVSASGYVLTVLYAAHVAVNRVLPLVVEGDSSNIGLAYIAHTFARHPGLALAAYAGLIATACGHMAWGMAQWLGLADGRSSKRRRMSVNAAAAGMAALWAAGGLGVVARGGAAQGWVAAAYDDMLAAVRLANYLLKDFVLKLLHTCILLRFLRGARLQNLRRRWFRYPERGLCSPFALLPATEDAPPLISSPPLVSSSLLLPLSSSPLLSTSILLPLWAAAFTLDSLVRKESRNLPVVMAGVKRPQVPDDGENDMEERRLPPALRQSAAALKNFILMLSEEILVRILSYMNESELLTISLVSRRLNRITADSHLWRVHCFNRFIAPRCLRFPHFHPSMPTPRRRILDSDIDAHHEPPVDWRKQYKLRHNWSQGQCAINQLLLGGAYPQSSLVPAPPQWQTLVKVVDGLAVTADARAGLRAWNLRTRELIAQFGLDGPLYLHPTCLAIDDQQLHKAALLDIAAGFHQGTFAVWRLDIRQRKLVSLYCQESGDCDPLIAIAYQHPYVLTSSSSGFLRLWAFDSVDDENDNSNEPAEVLRLASSSPLTALKSYNLQMPVALSIRNTATAVVASVVYTSHSLNGWVISIHDQDIRRTTEGSHVKVSTSRTASTLPTRTRRSELADERRRRRARRRRGHRDANYLEDDDDDGEGEADDELDGPIRLSYNHPYLLVTLPDNCMVIYLCRATATSMTISPGTHLWGHTSGISDAEITRRGKAVSVSSRGDEIRLWELEGCFDAPSVEVRPRQPTGEGQESETTASLDAEYSCMKKWVGFDEEMVVVLQETEDGEESLPGAYKRTTRHVRHQVTLDGAASGIIRPRHDVASGRNMCNA